MPHDTMTIVFLILAAIAFGFETFLARSIIAGGLLMATLAFLIPMIAK